MVFRKHSARWLIQHGRTPSRGSAVCADLLVTVLGGLGGGGGGGRDTTDPVGLQRPRYSRGTPRSQPVGGPCVSLVILEPLCPVDHKPRENIICHQNGCFWKLSCLLSQDWRQPDKVGW